MLFGREHVAVYRETGGEVGHEWRPGVHTLLLTTRGRRSGRPYTTPLIYRRDGDDYLVIASKGGAESHPDWYRNLVAEPEVEIQVGPEVMKATARTTSADEKARLWPRLAEVWPDFDAYTKKTDRVIPLVIITPRG